MLHLPPLFLLLIGFLSTVMPATSASLSLRARPCPNGFGCDTEGFFCCGIQCCSPGQDCDGGHCKAPPPPPKATVPPQISVDHWVPDNCVINGDGTETCPASQEPQYRISGHGFSTGSVGVVISDANGLAIWSNTVQSSYSGDPATLATISVDTSVLACDSDPGQSQMGVAVTADLTTGLTSNEVTVYVDCPFID